MTYFNRAVYDANWRVPAADNIIIVDAGSLVGFLLTIKNCEFYRFNYLNDLYAVDLMGAEFRFAVVYRLSNYTNNISLMVVIFTREGEPVDTIQDVYTSSTWPERESWEMVGVYFAGHRQLQRLLTDYGFKGHPLRKDFPVVGYRELWYSYRTKSVEFSKVEFMQEMRKFEFIVA